MEQESEALPEPAKLLAATSGLLSDDFRPIFSPSELSSQSSRVSAVLHFREDALRPQVVIKKSLDLYQLEI